MKTSRMTRVLAIVLAMMTVCSTVLLASCSKEETPISLSIDQIWKTDYKEADQVNQKIIVSVDGNKLTYQDACGPLVLFKGTGADTGLTRTVLYNVVNGSPLFDTETSSVVDVTFFENDKNYTTGEFVGYVRKTTSATGDSVTSALYDGAGTQYKSVPYAATATNVNDLIVFAGTAYRFAPDGTLTEAFNVGLKDLPTTNCLVGDAYIYVQGADHVVVYNKNYDVVAVYEAPAGAIGMTTSVLGNGNVLVQYSVRLLDEATEYDYIQTNSTTNLVEKYDLVTEIFEVETKNVTALDVDFLVASLENSNTNVNFEDRYVGDVTIGEGEEAVVVAVNLATIQYIENGFISQYPVLAIVNNDGEIVEELTNKFGKNTSRVRLIGDNRFVVADTLSLDYSLANEKGEILGVVSSLNGATESFLIKDRYVYDFDLNLVYTLAYNESIANTTTDALVISRTDRETLVDSVTGIETTATVVSYWLLAEGSTTPVMIANGKTTQMEECDDDYYCIKVNSTESITTYRYYSYDGNLLHESSVKLVECKETDAGILFAMTVLDISIADATVYNTTYYFFKK